MASCHPERKHCAKGLCHQCYDPAYRASHKEEIRVKGAIYYATHREESKARGRLYKATHREEIAARQVLYHKAHRDERRAYKNALNAAHHAHNKLTAFNAYGGPKCACCGETLLEGLTLDHINGDGAKHRKETGSGSKVYSWLKKNNYPPGFQVLCATCNQAKRGHDHCPHQDMVP